MDAYRLQFAHSYPGNYISFMELSVDGRFLILGDGRIACLRVLQVDHCIGPRPAISMDVSLAANPTSLTFESSISFFVGLSDGRFAKYLIDLSANRLVHQWTNDTLHGVFPVTALTLDSTARVLALATGPRISLFHRPTKTGEFDFVNDVSGDLKLKRDLGDPKSLCFASTGTLYVAFHRQTLVSVTLSFEKRSGKPTFLNHTIGYSGLPILKTVTSPEGLYGDLHRFRIYGDGPGGKTHPFLFIDGGIATLSSDKPGFALVRDVVTRRQIQALTHEGGGRTAGSLMIAYASCPGGTSRFIATATKSSINLWETSRLPSPCQPPKSSGSMLVVLLMGAVSLFVAMVFINGRHKGWNTLGEK